MQTAIVIATTTAAPLHLRSSDQLRNERISSRSCWTDSVWILDVDTIGQSTTMARINWDFELPDGSSLLHHDHANLLDVLRRFVWSLFVAPAEDSSAYKTSSLQHISQSLRKFVPWMISNGYNRFDELDADALDQYKDDIPAILVSDSESDDTEIGWSAAYTVLLLPSLLWRQRDVLAEAGLPCLPHMPWNGASLSALAESIATKARAQILPIPAEVAVPILNTAHRLIGTPAEDVVELSRAYVDAYNRAKPSVNFLAARQAILDFEFSTLEGEKCPWRPPIDGTRGRTLRTENPADCAVAELRALMADIRNACINIVQATTGMRSSEMCALPAGLDPHSRLPICVEMQTSASELYEVFTVKSLLSKTEETPRHEDWVVGMRLIGTDEIPPAVRALQVLNDLMSTWRTTIPEDPPLLVWFTKGVGIHPSTPPNAVAPMTVAALAYGVKDFILRNVDLTNISDTSRHAIEEGDLIPYRESQGTCIRPHQWRKTLAHFVFNSDSRLLPALMMQFKHVSMAMTADDYLGHNQAMFQAFDSARAQETAMFLYELVNGKSLVAGRMGQQIEEHLKPIRQLVDGIPAHDGWNKILSIVIDDGIRLWFAPHGKCLPLKRGEMRCHEVAGTAHWLNKEPSYAVREPSLCAGCACFVVDERHADFWKGRFIKNWASWRHAESTGHQAQFRVIFERANQARNLLTRLGIDTDELEKRALEQGVCDA